MERCSDGNEFESVIGDVLRARRHARSGVKGRKLSGRERLKLLQEFGSSLPEKKRSNLVARTGNPREFPTV